MSRYFNYFHPLFIATAPALFLWSTNFGEVALREVFFALIVLVIIGGAGIGIFFLIFRDPDKAVIATSLSLFIVLFWGYLYNTILLSLFALGLKVAFIAIFIVWLVLMFMLLRTRKNISALNRSASLILAIFIAISIFQLGYQAIDQYGSEPETQQATTAAPSDTTLRDMYYIVLDGYSSPDVISDVMGYEGIDTFVTTLEDNGFFVATDSRSNYGVTRLSLPSSLNMQHLQTPESRKQHYIMVDDNAVKDFLKSYGYTYIHVGSDSFTFHNPHADKNINLGVFTPYHMALWEQTIFFPLEQSFGGHGTFFEALGFLNRRKLQWDRTIFKFDALKTLAMTEEQPVFVFAHFLLPQGSNAFDARGDFVPQHVLEQQSQAEIYLQQVQYINKKIERLITHLKATSDPDPIIIIQGDHGYQFHTDPQFNDVETLAQQLPPSIAVQELLVPQTTYSLPILNAYHFPDNKTDMLYEHISPVNSFRVVFNTYFDQDLPLLEDTSYIASPEDSTKFIPLEP